MENKIENKIQFRNHFTTIIEKSMRGIGLVFFAFIGSFLTDTSEADAAQMLEDSLIIGLIMLGILVLLIGYQVIVWAKTTITISENTIVVERKTWNRKVNTIGIKNISNVNLEQNMLEMILGTSTVKLDTNTLSTADQTDLAIVLKKKDAEAFRQALLNRSQGKDFVVEGEQGEQNSERKYISTLDDVAVHGLFSINILAVVILIGAIVLVVVLFTDMISDPETGLLQAIGTLLMFMWAIGGWIWNIMKNFVKYADFQIERKGNKIFLNYGILKKVAYSIPVDKINAVRLNQTSIARIGKYYMAEVINVGMDDDENEAFSFFLPYSKKDKLKQLFELLLPEFSDCLDIKEEKQPKSIWILWIPFAAIYSIVMTAVFFVGMELAWTYMGDSEGFEWVLIWTIGTLSAVLLISRIANYFTAGCNAHDKFFQIVSGSFFKQTIFMKYDKIQYVQTTQNILAKCYGIEKGDIHILASMKNQTHMIPYCREAMMDELRKKILE